MKGNDTKQRIEYLVDAITEFAMGGLLVACAVQTRDSYAGGYFLPFMVLPIYTVLIKLDPKIIEAAQDLGAPQSIVFRRVIFPLSLPGVISGITMVFVPAVSTFVISKMLGGGKEILVGDLIELQFMGNAYNPQVGSAVALVMMILIFVCMAIMNRFDDGSNEEGGLLL